MTTMNPVKTRKNKVRDVMPGRHLQLWAARLGCTVLLSIGAVACGDDDEPAPTPAAGKGGSGAAGARAGASGSQAGSGGSGETPDCYEAPKTHLELINACTDAEKVEVDPDLPLLEPNGELPPLP